MSEAILATAPPTFALVGQGLGGDVALDILRRDSARVTRVVLISTDPLAEAPASAAAREARIVAAKSGRLKEVILQEYPASALADTEWRPEVLAVLQDMGPDIGRRGVPAPIPRAATPPRSAKRPCAAPTCPALIIAGAVDTLLPVRRQDFVAQLMPYGKLVTIPQAGQLPNARATRGGHRRLGGLSRGPDDAAAYVPAATLTLARLACALPELASRKFSTRGRMFNRQLLPAKDAVMARARFQMVGFLVFGAAPSAAVSAATHCPGALMSSLAPSTVITATWVIAPISTFLPFTVNSFSAISRFLKMRSTVVQVEFRRHVHHGKVFVIETGYAHRDPMPRRVRRA